jgi:tRNA modification GTPase
MFMSNCSANHDTIVAQATAAGTAGVGIIRVSGPLVQKIALELCGALPKARYATFTHFRDAQGVDIDVGLTLYFPAPYSFTGEDVLELHGHGGRVVLDSLLERVLELGARLAQPGEFSERAFFNDKMDLAQAEALIDLINASSRQAAQSAMRSLQGEFSRLIAVLVEQLIALRVHAEAMIDFADEELDFKTTEKLQLDLTQILASLSNVIANAEQGMLLHDGMTVVMAGKPNVGKSSLLNLFTGQDTAIVSHIAGTTRDVLREQITIDGLPLHILDTAGLQLTHDLVEQEGIRRAEKEIKNADKILLVVDVSVPGIEEMSPCELTKDIAAFATQDNTIIVYNKIDLTGKVAQVAKKDGFTCVYLVAKNGLGFNLLTEQLKLSIGFKASAETDTAFSARRRHVEALQKTQNYLLAAQEKISSLSHLELLAEDLRQAQNQLQTITGEFTADDLLGRIFADFCIGK